MHLLTNGQPSTLKIQAVSSLLDCLDDLQVANEDFDGPNQASEPADWSSCRRINHKRVTTFRLCNRRFNEESVPGTPTLA